MQGRCRCDDILRPEQPSLLFELHLAAIFVLLVCFQPRDSNVDNLLPCTQSNSRNLRSLESNIIIIWFSFPSAGLNPYRVQCERLFGPLRSIGHDDLLLTEYAYVGIYNGVIEFQSEKVYVIYLSTNIPTFSSVVCPTTAFRLN